MTNIPLEPIDSLHITILVDNYNNAVMRVMGNRIMSNGSHGVDIGNSSSGAAFLVDIVGNIVSDNGGSGPGYFEPLFADTALTPVASGSAPFTGSFKPTQPLAALDGQTATGTWMLEVTDDAAGDTGSLTGYQLHFCIE